MHAYVRDLAWFCIVIGALFAFPAAAMPTRRSAPQRHSRHGRSREGAGRPAGEGWPDLRTCLTVMAIGASLLADESSGHQARLLASVPIFAVLVWNLASWLGSRRRRRPGNGRGQGGYSDPRYRGRPADYGGLSR